MIELQRHELRKHLADTFDRLCDVPVIVVKSRTRNQRDSYLLSDTHYQALAADSEELKRRLRIEKETVGSRLAARLRIAHRLLSEVPQHLTGSMHARQIPSVMPEDIALSLGMNTLAAFEDAMLERSMPSIEYLEKFGNTYGFSREWLLTGKGSIFQQFRGTETDQGIQEFIETEKLSHIVFIRTDDHQQDIRLLMGDGLYRWFVLPSRWCLAYSRLMNEEWHLKGFYEILAMAFGKSGLGGSLKVSSLSIDIQTEQNFIDEKIHPAALAFSASDRPNSKNWADDFRDIMWRHGEYTDRLEYRYGKDFVGCMRYLKSELNSDQFFRAKIEKYDRW